VASAGKIMVEKQGGMKNNYTKRNAKKTINQYEPFWQVKEIKQRTIQLNLTNKQKK
jgi:hypothetical protein